jgi:uncharacterized DUF497 family protein
VSLEAVTVLDDECALTLEDSEADDVPRFVTLGPSDVGNLLLVVYTYREPDILRVISARKATRCPGVTARP